MHSLSSIKASPFLIAGAKAARNELRLWGLPNITVRVGTRMAVDGHGHAMTIADYSAIGVLIVLAIWAGARLYLRGKL